MNLLAIGALPIALAASALAIDVGSLYLAQRTLQGAADAAAIAAVRDPSAAQDAAGRSLADARLAEARVVSVETGSYRRESATPADSRFRPGDGSGAAQVRLEQRVPLFFGRVITGNATDTVTASAIAARLDLAAFAIGSRLASIEGGIANGILSALAGTDLSLTAMDYQALASADIDLLAFSDALRTELGMEAATFGQTLASTITLPQAMRALAASSGGEASTVFSRIATRVPGLSVRLDRLIDLGPYASSDLARGSTVPSVDSAAMLRTILEIANGSRQVSADLGTTIPGLGETRVTIAIGERPARSPWLTISAAGDAVVRTAQARVQIETRLPIAGVGQVRLPLVAEIASAEARISAIDCVGGRASAAATLAVTPSVGRLVLGAVDPATLGDFNRELTPTDATLVQLPLVRVTALGDLRLGGASSQSVRFTRAEIDADTTKSVATNDIAQASIASLIAGTDIDVTVLGLGLSASSITTAIGTGVSAAAPTLDTLLADVTRLVGLRLGEADVRVLALRCGAPMLVG